MLAFDTETTGLLKPEATELFLQPFITEIYIGKFDENFQLVGEFSTLVKPPVPIPELITKITGITDDMLIGQPSFIEIYDSLVDFFLGETEIFAHNCSFDIAMLANELRRCDLLTKFPWPKNQRCTVELSFPIQNKRMSLKALYKLVTGEDEIPGAHRAKNDVLAMVECIKWLKEKGFCE